VYASSDGRLDVCDEVIKLGDLAHEIVRVVLIHTQTQTHTHTYIYTYIPIYICVCGGKPARKAAIGSRRRLLTQALKIHLRELPFGSNAILGSVPCACVLVSPVYINRLGMQIRRRAP